MTAVELCGILLLFFIYAFLGWCFESTVCSVSQHKLVNRGFLSGPVVPVYACGALAVVYCLSPVQDNLPLLYLCSVVLMSAIEYFTGWLLETLFHTRWWDYSSHKFNLHGRICLANCLIFGLMAVLALKLLHPLVLHLVGSLSLVVLVWWASSCTTLFAVDLFLSVRTAMQLSGKLDALQAALAEARERTEAVIAEKKLAAEQFGGMSLSERVDALLERGESLSLHDRLHELTHSHNMLHRRMLDAFPTMKPRHNKASLDELRAAIAKARREYRDAKAARKAKKAKNA